MGHGRWARCLPLYKVEQAQQTEKAWTILGGRLGDGEPAVTRPDPSDSSDAAADATADAPGAKSVPLFERVEGCTLIMCGLDHVLFHFSQIPF